MSAQLAFIARFAGEDWVSLIHGQTRGQAKARFVRACPLTQVYCMAVPEAKHD